jgi:hypothetical protein
MDIMRKRPEFDSRLWSVVACLFAITAINAASAVVLSRAIAHRILLHDGQVAQEFLNSIIATEGSGGRLFDTPAPGPALVSFANHVRNLPGMVRANIYSLDGFIRYSTEANLIGLKFTDNPELTASFEGKLISNLETVSDDNKPEHLALNRLSGEQLVEAYIPVGDGTGGVAAVVEFYKNPATVKAVIGEVTGLIWMSAALGGLLTFLALSAALRWAKVIGA